MNDELLFLERTEGQNLPDHAVGLLMGHMSALGNAIITLERALAGFGMVQLVDDDVLVSATNLFDSSFLNDMANVKGELYRMINDVMLPTIPGYEEFLENIDEVVEKGQSYGR